MEHYIQLDGLVVSKHNKDEMFRILEEHGFEYTGGVGQITNEEVTEAIEYILNTIDESKLSKIRNIIEEHYGDFNLESTKDFLEGNFGTGIFHKVFESVLEADALIKFKYYANTNWIISDHFEGTLGSRIANMY